MGTNEPMSTGYSSAANPDADATDAVVATIAMLATMAPTKTLNLATIETTGCNYVLHSNGDVEVACSGENVITVSVFTCVATFGSQELSDAVSYENVANGDILVGADLDDIAVTKTDGFLCPLNGSGPGTASFVGDILASGSYEGSPIDISVTE